MRDYGRVHTTFWASETMRGLGDDAKFLALYLMTCQHAHMAGVFHLPAAYAAHDTGWSADRLADGFKALSDGGWLRRCDRTGWVWIINFLKFNPPANPNMAKAVDKQVALVPGNCSFYREIGNRFGTVVKPLGNTPVPVPVPVSTSEAAALIPLEDGSDHPVTEAEIAEWRAAYPRIDVLAEVRKARAWCIANPSKRKTARGVARFLNTWLSSANEKAPPKVVSLADLPGGGRRRL